MGVVCELVGELDRHGDGSDVKGRGSEGRVRRELKLEGGDVVVESSASDEGFLIREPSVDWDGLVGRGRGSVEVFESADGGRESSAERRNETGRGEHSTILWPKGEENRQT